MNTAYLHFSVTKQVACGVSPYMADYMIGGILALLILGYLIYSLLKPEKF